MVQTNTQASQRRGRGLMLELFENINFMGRRIVFRGGEVAVRDARALDFNDLLSSFRVQNRMNPNRVTLVLFEDINYQGDFRVFRGSQNVADLRTINFNDEMSSFVLVARRLTNAQIRAIQNSMRAPQGVVEIFQ
ncbi:hypothetical protein DNHGIG_38540 [Collibacillus ludicampi]|uniref:Uncharacterized protein n=1 Tax=Collibacillus ludicampi TaxID=2771369 RepID=A0AAV4LKC1_9BACL|nr:hypothetical protein [Collibacillus ludicampi]GIM48305.1 hypothetical protein DNHGIG_38540 [Collibacillus ludicampi]